MGWFDNYALGCFKTLRDGREGFYPYLINRRGYVVPGEQRTVLRRFMFVAGIFGPLLGVMAGDAILLWNFPINLILFIVSFSLFAVGYYGSLRWLTKNLECAPADEKPTVGERYRTNARHTPWILLCFVEIVGVVFALFGLSKAATGWGTHAASIGMSGAAFGGLLAWMAGYMLWAKWTRSLDAQ